MSLENSKRRISFDLHRDVMTVKWKWNRQSHRIEITWQCYVTYWFCAVMMIVNNGAQELWVLSPHKTVQHDPLMCLRICRRLLLKFECQKTNILVWSKIKLNFNRIKDIVGGNDDMWCRSKHLKDVTERLELKMSEIAFKLPFEMTKKLKGRFSDCWFRSYFNVKLNEENCLHCFPEKICRKIMKQSWNEVFVISLS